MLIGMMTSKPNFLPLRPEPSFYCSDNQLVEKFESKAYATAHAVWPMDL
jgi:hypothetical protein